MHKLNNATDRKINTGDEVKSIITLGLKILTPSQPLDDKPERTDEFKWIPNHGQYLGDR